MSTTDLRTENLNTEGARYYYENLTTSTQIKLNGNNMHRKLLNLDKSQTLAERYVEKENKKTVFARMQEGVWLP